MMSFTKEPGPAEPGDQASDRLLERREEGRKPEDANEVPESNRRSRPAYSLECILAEVY